MGNWNENENVNLDFYRGHDSGRWTRILYDYIKEFLQSLSVSLFDAFSEIKKGYPRQCDFYAMNIQRYTELEG